MWLPSSVCCSLRRIWSRLVCKSWCRTTLRTQTLIVLRWLVIRIESCWLRRRTRCHWSRHRLWTRIESTRIHVWIHSGRLHRWNIRVRQAWSCMRWPDRSPWLPGRWPHRFCRGLPRWLLPMRLGLRLTSLLHQSLSISAVSRISSHH